MSRNFAYRLNAGGAKVTPREGRVSRNQKALDKAVESSAVTPREGRVSRNPIYQYLIDFFRVTPREGRVSRN